MPQAQTVRETFNTTLNIPSGGTVTSEYVTVDQRKAGAAMMVYIPAGFNGLLQFKACDTPDGAYEVCYDDEGYLLQIDPTSKILPSWHMVPVEIFPAHYVKIASVASSAGTAGTAQSAARALPVMGLS
jgi:hypothetical protein